MATTTVTKEPVKLFKGFNAVDLVTLAVFGTLYRALWYFWHALGFMYPFNQAFSAMFFVLFCVASVVIVRKLGAATLFAVASQIINMFLQGEVLWVAFLLATCGIIADLYFFFRMRARADLFNAKREVVIAGTLFGIWWSAINFAYIFPVLFQTTFAPVIAVSAGVVCALGGFIGALIGYGLGQRVKGLIG